ncbi:LPXTG cell wall anchor domain-containing protein [Kitasatospora sp. NPDC091207]|uniref:LPXTG cell wall anchor domain-containing protein n=1 Tax=Kitasatospora sp. NPDC091207 TaxID=3364083 RepID=UPI003813B508
MRTSRLLAACAAVTASLGLGLGAASAAPLADPTATPAAAASNPSGSAAPSTGPTGDPTDPAPNTAPTAGPTTGPTAAPTATGTTTPTTAPTDTPTATPSATPTGTPTPTGSPTEQPCTFAHRPVATIPVSWNDSGYPELSLVKGGPAVESTVTVRNTTGYDLPEFSSTFTVIGHGVRNLTAETRFPGGAWSTGTPVEGSDSWLQVPLQTFRLAKDESLTFRLRLAAGRDAVAEKVGFSLNAQSSFTYEQPGRDYCRTVANASGGITVTEATGTGTTPSTPDPTTTPTSPTVPATGTPSPSASPAAGGGGTAATGGQGTQLAHTGAGSTTPLAAGAVGAVAVGLATVLVVRRRREHAGS